MSRQAEVLRVTDVNVNLGGVRVLHDVSFGINAGELIALVGPNGAGKTTLIRSILGLIPTASGEITGSAMVDGVRGKGRSSTLRTRIGYVPQRQDARWDYPISVEQVVLSALRPGIFTTTRQWRAVYDALDAVGMIDFRARRIGALSGGQKQRVLIARALVTGPSMLALDEPFTGLDHPNQDLLAGLYRSLVERGISILMSTHDLAQAVTICDRLLLLNRSVRGVGTVEELADPRLWAQTYEVSEDSAVVRMVSALSSQPEETVTLAAPVGTAQPRGAA